MINSVTLVGNLGKDPVVKDIKDTKRGSFSLATTEKWRTRDGEQKSKTTWNNIVVWGKLCEIVESLEKGQEVLVIGKIGTRFWGEGDAKKTISEITANIVMPFIKKEKVEKPKEDEDYYQEDDLPF